MVVDKGAVDDSWSCLRVEGEPSEFPSCVGDVIAVGPGTVKVS
jgi:hypothetical protein